MNHISFSCFFLQHQVERFAVKKVQITCQLSTCLHPHLNVSVGKEEKGNVHIWFSSQSENNTSAFMYIKTLQ